VPAVVPVAVSVWAIVVPEVAVAPETPACTTVQEKAVPPRLLVSAMEGAVPEHIVCDAGVVVATGVGFTVIIATFGVPEHPLAVGVIV